MHAPATSFKLAVMMLPMQVSLSHQMLCRAARGLLQHCLYLALCIFCRALHGARAQRTDVSCYGASLGAHTRCSVVISCTALDGSCMQGADILACTCITCCL